MVAARRRQHSAVPSVQPSATTSTSNDPAGAVCRASAASPRSSERQRLYVGITTLARSTCLVAGVVESGDVTRTRPILPFFSVCAGSCRHKGTLRDEQGRYGCAGVEGWLRMVSPHPHEQAGGISQQPSAALKSRSAPEGTSAARFCPLISPRRRE